MPPLAPTLAPQKFRPRKEQDIDNIQRLFKDIQCFATIQCGFIVIARLKGNIPRPRNFIVPHFARRKFGIGRRSEKVLDKIIDNVRRTPRSAYRCVNVFGGYRFENYLFNGTQVFREMPPKNPIRLVDGILFAHKIAKVFVSGFPPLIEAFFPLFRVLVDSSLQTLDYRFIISTRNGRHVLNVHSAKRYLR